MAFVNEMVSEEDIKEHGLDSLKRSYYPFEWRNGRPSSFAPAWVVDRDRSMYAMPIYTVQEVGRSGRQEPTTKQVWVIGWRDKLGRCVLDRGSESSTSIHDSPYRIHWRLLELDMGDLAALSRDAVAEAVKEALSAYGHAGAHKQVPNTIVTCDF